VLQPTEKGLWRQAKTSLDKAASSGAEFILYTEPDKIDFFKYLAKWFNGIEVSNEIGIALASRSKAGFESFPTFQQMTETTINNSCEEVIGLNLGYTYGPFIINQQLISQLQQLPKNIGWGWRPYAFNIASRLGFKIKSYENDFFCPLDQTEDNQEERLYRMKQLNQNIEGIVLSATAQLEKVNYL
jgi:hypothetical protein